MSQHETTPEVDEFWGGIWWVPDGAGKLCDATPGECATEIKRLRCENLKLEEALHRVGQTAIRAAEEIEEAWSNWEAESAGFECNPGVSLIVVDTAHWAHCGSRWFSWAETVALYKWLGEKIKETNPMNDTTLALYRILELVKNAPGSGQSSTLAEIEKAARAALKKEKNDGQ